VGVVRHAAVALPPGKRPSTHCTGGCGRTPARVFKGAENLAPHRDSITGPSCWLVIRYYDWAIPAHTQEHNTIPKSSFPSLFLLPHNLWNYLYCNQLYTENLIAAHTYRVFNGNILSLVGSQFSSRMRLAGRYCPSRALNPGVLCFGELRDHGHLVTKE